MVHIKINMAGVWTLNLLGNNNMLVTLEPDKKKNNFSFELRGCMKFIGENIGQQRVSTIFFVLFDIVRKENLHRSIYAS